MLQYGNHTEQVHKRLRDLIVYGELAPGTRIIEADIVDSLGVSRTPVRAALQLLLQEGFLVSIGTKKKSKLAVAPLTQADARELFTLVGCLEGLGATGAARTPDGGRGSLVRELRRVNRDMSAAASDRSDPGRIFELDTLFHDLYMDAGAGPRVRALHRSTKPQAERYIRLYYNALTDEAHTSVREHETIIEAIGDGLPDTAREAVEVNWANAASRLKSVISEQGERGSWYQPD